MSLIDETEPNESGASQASTGLVRYDAMCRAIDTAYEVDEVKDIRDKAAAIELYMRQAHNVEAERRCCEIRLRAERRVAQLYDQQEKAKGARGTGSNQYEVRSGNTTAPKLSDYGVTKQQMFDWRQLAKIPDDKFEEAVRTLDRPSREQVIEYAEGKTPQEPVNDKALWLWGRLRDFTRLSLLNMSPEEVLATMTDEMYNDVVSELPKVIAWLQSVEKQL